MTPTDTAPAFDLWILQRLADMAALVPKGKEVSGMPEAGVHLIGHGRILRAYATNRTAAAQTRFELHAEVPEFRATLDAKDLQVAAAAFTTRVSTRITADAPERIPVLAEPGRDGFGLYLPPEDNLFSGDGEDDDAAYTVRLAGEAEYPPVWKLIEDATSRRKSSEAVTLAPDLLALLHKAAGKPEWFNFEFHGKQRPVVVRPVQPPNDEPWVGVVQPVTI